jgi:Ca2+-binding EF-hand superfamily protein
MSKRKTVLFVAGALVAVGAVAAISAPGQRGFRGGDAMMFGGWDGDRFMDGGRRGWWRQPMTQDEFDATTRARFARLDKNGDGVIDASEIEGAMAKRFERHRGKHGGRLGERLMRAFDTDRDGKVTKDEFTATVRSRFAQLDLNNDGRITDEDLPPRLRGRDILASDSRMGRGPGRRILGLLRDADANKDSVVTLDEAMAAADKRFAGLDRNKDGVIDTVDRDALRTETVDYRVQRFIHYFGADADGKVTREQFTAKAKERFARMDLNNDGTIGRDERPGHHWRGHGERRGWWGRGGRDHNDNRDDAPETKPGDSLQPK